MPQKQPWERRFCREAGAGIIVKFSILKVFIFLSMSLLRISTDVNATHLRQWNAVPLGQRGNP
jgi:hypothetical protein